MINTYLTMDENYYKNIDECALNRINFPISNGEARHAAYLLRTFFKFAKERVCIYTGSLFPGVYENEELIKNAIMFLKNNSNAILRIAYQDNVSSEKIIKRKIIQEIIKNDLSPRLLLLNASSAGFKHKNLYPNHFALMDGEAYRYELDHVKRSAEANFGDPDIAMDLSIIFNKLIKTSKLVPIAS